MAVAYLPSPASAVWHLGTIPVRAYALCMVLGVVAGLWLTDRRYRRSRGRSGVILDLATVAVPVGLVGARAYSVLTNIHLYFGPGRDWTDVFRVWEGGMGVAGAVAAGAAAAWLYCRRAGLEIGPVALAAAPALAVAQAISVWGNWFSQELYGRPSGLPWAVAIAPQHRVLGFQTAATFQPLFVYESLLDLLIAVAVGYAIHRYALPGDRAFALYGALWAAAAGAIEALRIDYSPRFLGLRTNLLGMVAVLVIACAYLAVVRRRRLRRPSAEPASPAAFGLRSSRARSGREVADELGLALAAEPAAAEAAAADRVAADRVAADAPAAESVEAVPGAAAANGVQGPQLQV
jgi:prolipoprotein diacylglyceryl transferase